MFLLYCWHGKMRLLTDPLSMKRNFTSGMKLKIETLQCRFKISTCLEPSRGKFSHCEMPWESETKKVPRFVTGTQPKWKTSLEIRQNSIYSLHTFVPKWGEDVIITTELQYSATNWDIFSKPLTVPYCSSKDSPSHSAVPVECRTQYNWSTWIVNSELCCETWSVREIARLWLLTWGSDKGGVGDLLR